MKKIIILFLLIAFQLTMHAQIQKSNTINIDGVELSYNKIKKTMTLVVKPAIMQTNDYGMYTLIKISKSAELRIIINGEVISSTESYFSLEGHMLDSFWAFTTHKPYNCIDTFSPITKIGKYTFHDINQGDEYILSVSNLCDGKYETNYKSKSIIIK